MSEVGNVQKIILRSDRCWGYLIVAAGSIGSPIAHPDISAAIGMPPSGADFHDEKIESSQMALVCGIVSLVAYLFLVRPKVRIDENRVTVVNILRTHEFFLDSINLPESHARSDVVSVGGRSITVAAFDRGTRSSLGENRRTNPITSLALDRIDVGTSLTERLSAPRTTWTPMDGWSWTIVACTTAIVISINNLERVPVVGARRSWWSR